MIIHEDIVACSKRMDYCIYVHAENTRTKLYLAVVRLPFFYVYTNTSSTLCLAKHYSVHPITEINLVSRHLSYLIKVLYYKSLIRIYQKIHIVICFYKTDNLAVSLWRNIFNWIVALTQNGDPKSIDDVLASFFLAANDLLKGPYLNSSLVLVSAC